MNRTLRSAFVVLFALFAAQTVVQVSLPLRAFQLGLSGSSIGVLLALPIAIGLLLDIPVSAVSDALGRRVPVVTGGVLMSIGALTLTKGADFEGLFIGSVLFAIGIPLVTWPTLALTTEIALQPDHARVQGVNGAVQRGAVVASTIALTVLLAAHVEVSVTIAIAAACGVLVAAGGCLIEASAVESAQPFVSVVVTSYARAIYLLRTRRPIQMAGLISLVSTTSALVIGNSFAPLFITEELGLPVDVAALSLTVRNALAALLSLQFGRLVLVARPSVIIAASNACAALSTLVLAFTRTGWLLPLAFGLQGIGYGIAAPTSNLLVLAATARSERALGFASQQLLTRVGAILFPTVLGASLQAFGSRAMLTIGGLVIVAFTLALLVLLVRTAKEVDQAGGAADQLS